MNIKKGEWYLIAVSIAVGSIITITYDGLQACFIGLFDIKIRSFTCDPSAPAKMFTGLIAFLVGMAYLKIFMRPHKDNKTNDTDKSNSPHSES